jgi:hypothetical protein
MLTANSIAVLAHRASVRNIVTPLCRRAISLLARSKPERTAEASVPWNRPLTLTFPPDTAWRNSMSFEDKEAELGLLLTRMQNEPEDRHELYLQIRQKLNELKAYGMPLPETLVNLERQLEAEFAAEKGA